MKQPKVILFFVLFLWGVSLYASDNDTINQKSFNTVEYLFEHVNDSYEWHFLSNENYHVAIPLPVILYSASTGWHFFHSGKLVHPKPDFPFYLAHGGKNDGKIVEKLSDGSEVVPFDLSLTKSVLGAIIVGVILIILLLIVARRTSKNPFAKPRGVQNLIEPVVLFVRDELAKPFAGESYKRFTPYLLTVFFFVLTANLLGLILPLGFNITGNISVTLALGAFTFVITLASGNKKYWMHIINPDVPMFMKFPVPIMPVVEIAGVIIKPMILMIRLFANIFAGHIILSVLVALIFIMSTFVGVIAGSITSIISVVFSVFMVMLDILVSFIQAYIFTLLSAMYFGMATDKSSH